MEKDFDAKLNVQGNSSNGGNVPRSKSFAFRAPQENFTIQDFELGKIYGVGSYSKVSILNMLVYLFIIIMIIRILLLRLSFICFSMEFFKFDFRFVLFCSGSILLQFNISREIVMVFFQMERCLIRVVALCWFLYGNLGIGVRIYRYHRM